MNQKGGKTSDLFAIGASAQWKKHIEILLLFGILATAFVLRFDRVQFPGVPGGDEPSWMNVAAQVARGEGFTTRWLEHLFLSHQELPRPEDHRFPAYTAILAAAFKTFGISYQVAQYTQLLIAMLSMVMLYVLVSRAWGKACGLCTLFFTAISLEQIKWGSLVYSESLYALSMYGIMWWVIVFDRIRKRHWLLLALLTGLSYYVRPNALLFFPLLAMYAGVHARKKTITPRIALTVAVLPFIMILPWCIRNQVLFDDPFHVAAKGGFFVREYVDRWTPTLGAYAAKYGWGHVIARPVIGMYRFFGDVISFEHGLILPFLLLAPFSAARVWKLRGGPLITIVVAVQVLPAFWISYADWSGVRYVFFLWPLVFAMGTLTLLRAAGALKRFRLISIGLASVLLALPVIEPHRFYLRRNHVYAPPNIPDHRELVSFLSTGVGEEETYMAADRTVSAYSFLTTRKCVSAPILDPDNTTLPTIERLDTRYIVAQRGHSQWFERLFAANPGHRLHKIRQGAWWCAFEVIEVRSETGSGCAQNEVF